MVAAPGTALAPDLCMVFAPRLLPGSPWLPAPHTLGATVVAPAVAPARGGVPADGDVYVGSSPRGVYAAPRSPTPSATTSAGTSGVSTASTPAPRGFFDLPGDVQRAVRDRMRPHVGDRGLLDRYAALVTSDAFLGAPRDAQLAAVDALIRRPQDPTLGKDLRALLGDSKVSAAALPRVIEAYAQPGVTSATRAELGATARTPAYQALTTARQADVLARIGARPEGSAALYSLITTPGFAALPESTQAKALQAVDDPSRAPATRDMVERLLGTPELAKLDEAAQGRWLDALGHADPVVADRAAARLGEWLDKPQYQARSEDERALILTKLSRAASAPDTVEVPAGGYDHRATKSAVSGGERVRTSNTFESVEPAPARTYTVRVAGQSIEVVIPESPDPKGGHYPSLADVRAALEHLPPAARRELRRVVVEPRAEEDTGARARAKGVVSLYPDDAPRSLESLTSILTHESGHELGERLWGPLKATSKGWKAWEQAGERDGQWASSYAAHSPHEDLAETMVLYQHVRGTDAEAAARARFPARFAILDEALTTAR